MPDLEETNTFLNKLSSCHENLKFAMDVAEQNTIAIVGMNITKRCNRLKTSVCRKVTNTCLLLHHHSHVDLISWNFVCKSNRDYMYHIYYNIYYYISLIEMIKAKITNRAHEFETKASLLLSVLACWKCSILYKFHQPSWSIRQHLNFPRYHQNVNLLEPLKHISENSSPCKRAFFTQIHKRKFKFLFLSSSSPYLLAVAPNKFLYKIENIDAPKAINEDGTNIMALQLQFKDQQLANWVKRQMQSLSTNVGVRSKPVFQSKKIDQVHAPQEKKPPIVNNQCLIYKFESNLCDADYVGYTARHLHQCIHEHRYSAIGRHLEKHGLPKSALEDNQFSVLKKRRSKFVCLIFEMFVIKELKPVFNTQKKTICAKRFMWLCMLISGYTITTFLLYSSCLLGILLNLYLYTILFIFDLIMTLSKC